MSFHSPPRGGAAVGQLKELGTVEASSVIYMRLWTEDAGRREMMGHEFMHALGAEAGMRATQALAEMTYLMAQHGRRPLMRHAIDCKCLGGDEACFAQLVGLAAEGDLHEATLMASLMVPAGYAPKLAESAREFGHALARMAGRLNNSQAYETPKFIH